MVCLLRFSHLVKGKVESKALIIMYVIIYRGLFNLTENNEQRTVLQYQLRTIAVLFRDKKITQLCLILIIH